MTSNESQVPLHRFFHEAMTSNFEIAIVGEEETYAKQAAQAAFDEIDQVEQNLSRYIQSSDISRLNHLKKGMTAQVGLQAFECLQIAAQLYKDTNGVFDVTVGPLIDCWRSPDKSPRKPSSQELAQIRASVGMHLVALDPDNFSVTLKADNIHIDLGGIGKGFGVDKAGEVLQEWGIESAMISGGGSTVLALGKGPEGKGWALGVGGSGENTVTKEKIILTNHSLSGSGTQVRGHHIFDPRLGAPAKGPMATWAVAPTATVSDALSTAFMILSPKEVGVYCKKHPDSYGMILVSKDGKPTHLRYGDWQGDLRLQAAK